MAESAFLLDTNIVNDIWIAAVAGLSGLTLLSTDQAAFIPLRGTPWLDVIVLDAKTGAVLA
jgi:hypothetical protein